MLQYPVTLVREGSKTLVSFSDFPNVHTYGDDEEEALTRGVDALEGYLMSMIEDREPIPASHRPKRRQKFVTLPALTAAKIELYRQMRCRRWGRQTWRAAFIAASGKSTASSTSIMDRVLTRSSKLCWRWESG
jgi:predicted RNase H-like HicB family nuclease